MSSSEVAGTTGTGLDQFIDIIYFNPGLQKKISTGDIREGAAAANAMNEIIIDSIKATGIATDGSFDKADMQALSAYINTNHYSAWLVYHGDDEDGNNNVNLKRLASWLNQLLADDLAGGSLN